MAKQKVTQSGYDGTTVEAKPSLAPRDNADSGAEPSAKAARTIQYRGRTFQVIRTMRNRFTGAIYDYFVFDRPVKDRRTGKTSTAELTKKRRRSGTGEVVAKEETYHDEEEL